MRIHLHDFSGHPFQVQLSRRLAARGHDVLHVYCTQYVTGHGKLSVGPDDPGTLRIEGLRARRALVKYSPVGRVQFELSYASAWREYLAAHPADVAVSCNVPLFALSRVHSYLRRSRQPWVFWHQDVYSAGIGDEAERALPPRIGRRVRWRVEAMEAALVESSTAVVAIGEPFLQKYAEWGVRTEHVHVIPNWAPLDDITPRRRQNPWSSGRIADAGLRLLYAGTLGRKHNPTLLTALNDACRARGVDGQLVVVSEGEGADAVRAASAGRSDVVQFGFQPSEALPDVLGSADVLLALLEPSAAHFSIPSKVLSYLAAGRPVLALAPPDNPAMRQITEAGGFVAAPTASGVQQAADWLARLAADPIGRQRIGHESRALAEREFDVDRITDRFEAVLSRAAAQPAPAVRARRGYRPVVARSGV